MCLWCGVVCVRALEVELKIGHEVKVQESELVGWLGW